MWPHPVQQIVDRLLSLFLRREHTSCETTEVRLSLGVCNERWTQTLELRVLRGRSKSRADKT